MRAIFLSFLIMSGIAGASARPPNLLFLFPDQYRGDWMPGLHDDILPLRMPTLRSLAANGTRFTNAYVPSPLCAPSRASLAAGREYDQNGGVTNNGQNFNLSLITFMTLLKNGGYHTMISGKDDLTKATGPGPLGSFNAAALGFIDYERCDGKGDVVNRGVPTEPYGITCALHNTTLPNGTSVTLWDILTTVDNDCCVPLPDGGSNGEDCPIASAIPDTFYEDNWVTSNALKLLDRKPTGQPWFLHVSWPGPHPPFITTQTMLNATAGRTWPLATGNAVTPVDMQQELRRDYAAELENLDRLFGLVIDRVRELGELDNTLIIMSSDHGEMLGDFNAWGKEMPWRGSATVPLVISGPSLGIPKGHSIDASPVTTLDIAGTLLDYAGITLAPGMTTTTLRSFLSTANNTITTPLSYRPFVSSGLTNHGLGWRAVIQQNGAKIWKYICCTGLFCEGRNNNNNTARMDTDWKTRITTAAAAHEAGYSKTAANFTEWLVETVTDPFDSTNVAMNHPTVVASLRALLPPGWCQ